MSTDKTRRELSAERRSVILNATFDLVKEKGLHKTTIADIRKRSGASIGSIYHHFGDREGVLYALYHESFVDWFGELREAVLGEDSAEAGVTALVHRFLDWIANNPDRARFIYDASQGALLSSYQDQLLAFKAEFYADIMAWMLPFIATGQVIAMPPWAYDAIIMGPAHEFARRWLGGMDGLTMDEAKPIIVGAIWRAIQAPQTP